MTKELEKKLPKYETETTEDTFVMVHYFNPNGAGDWFGLTYDPIDKIFFGYVSIFGDHNDELGDFSLAELAEFRGRLGLGIERDLHWTPKPLKEVTREYTKL